MKNYVYVIWFNHSSEMNHTPQASLIGVSHSKAQAEITKREWLLKHGEEDWAYPEDVLMQKMYIEEDTR